jgi:hypothetical protein
MDDARDVLSKRKDQCKDRRFSMLLRWVRIRWGGVVCVCCLYRPPALHIRLFVRHLGVCMSTNSPQRSDIRLPGRRSCVKKVCMSWPCSCMDLTLLMWMIIPTLAQIMKRMLATLYRCDKIYVLHIYTKCTHRSVVEVVCSFAHLVYPTKHLPGFDCIWYDLSMSVFLTYWARATVRN